MGDEEETAMTDTEYDGEGPSAPPEELLDPVAGYEGTPADGEGKNLPPPPDRVKKLSEDDPRPSSPEYRIPKVTEDVAREALREFAASKCCYSSTPAREMSFHELKPLTTYRYRLETFTETRSSGWAFEPYADQIVDGPQYGYPPLPWDIMVEPPSMYRNDEKKVRVPHTSSVKTCHKCKGKGRIKCSNCHGRGKVRCTMCHGDGKRGNGDRCMTCSGTGKRRCSSCFGHGYKTCDVCQGKKQLLHFIQLTVIWKDNIFEHVPDRQPGFPVTLFSKVQGENIFQDANFLVYPIVGFPEPEICEASKKAIDEHFAQFSTLSRILEQRQTIELIPLTEIHYDYKGYTYSYFVFGAENQVHAPTYPGKCCGCTVL
ncbi:protein SSUH2 homolog [Latimeria chalumnae]|uniref:protein SSUH2 homolog n=1 Tax=Latimeria chalumnae TaxID=7897 RepID=UPI00313C1230